MLLVHDLSDCPDVHGLPNVPGFPDVHDCIDFIDVPGVNDCHVFLDVLDDLDFSKVS